MTHAARDSDRSGDRGAIRRRAETVRRVCTVRATIGSRRARPAARGMSELEVSRPVMVRSAVLGLAQLGSTSLARLGQAWLAFAKLDSP